MLLVFFYISLNAWRKDDKALNVLLTIAQVAGIFSSLALMTASIFTIGTHPAVHGFFSMLMTIGMTWFLCFVNTALLRHGGFRKWTGYYGFLWRPAPPSFTAYSSIRIWRVDRHRYVYDLYNLVGHGRPDTHIVIIPKEHRRTLTEVTDTGLLAKSWPWRKC